MARTPRSAEEKLAMRKKKSRALLLFNIIAFSVVVIGAVLLCIFVFFTFYLLLFALYSVYVCAERP